MRTLSDTSLIIYQSNTLLSMLLKIRCLMNSLILVLHKLLQLNNLTSK